MYRVWMSALLKCMWLAAADMYCVSLMRSSFRATFHTLLPSIIVANAHKLRHSELCFIHALCYANMSAMLFACRLSNVNHMFTPTLYIFCCEVRKPFCNSWYNYNFVLFFIENPMNSRIQKHIDGVICFLDLVDLLWPLNPEHDTFPRP